MTPEHRETLADLALELQGVEAYALQSVESLDRLGELLGPEAPECVDEAECSARMLAERARRRLDALTALLDETRDPPPAA